MAVITFLSDFGTADHYVAAVKAAIISKSPQQLITDISHDIRPFDIAHAAHVLKQVYLDFPEKTVHLVAVDSMRNESKALAIELDGHFFVGFDSGLFSLISSNKPSQICYLETVETTFPAKHVLADAALALAKGKRIKEVGTPGESMVELFSRQLKVTKREIAGNVVSVDHYGNLITNITKEEFDTIRKINGVRVKYVIRFGRESFTEVNQFFTDVESGDCFVLFNSSGDLQIGINKGNASELLGLSVDAPVIIEFSSE